MDSMGLFTVHWSQRFLLHCGSIVVHRVEEAGVLSFVRFRVVATGFCNIPTRRVNLYQLVRIVDILGMVLERTSYRSRATEQQSVGSISYHGT